MSTAAPLQQAEAASSQQQQMSRSPEHISQLADDGKEFADAGPQAIAQRRLQAIADNSPRARQLQALQLMAQAGTQAMQLKAAYAMMNMPDRAPASETPARPGQTKHLRHEARQSPPVQLRPETVQLAISENLAAGTRIMVANPAARDAGDIGTVIGPSTVKPYCMRVRFDNEPDTIYRVYFHEIVVVSTPEQQDGNEDQLLNAMILGAIAAAEAIPEQLGAVMETDKTPENDGELAVPPEQQLARCRAACANLSAEETATYLYTTYFFGPLNRYLRDRVAPAPEILELISVTHALLMRAFAGTAGEKLVPRFRMELKAEWIGAKGVGDELSFPAFTSTHPDLESVNGMWPDIQSGAFGEIGKLALLVFEGKSKELNPQQKYFPNENEMILPPGMKATISQKYDIDWDEYNDDGEFVKKWVITVYHLTMTEAPDEFIPPLQFNEGGYVVISDD